MTTKLAFTVESSKPNANLNVQVKIDQEVLFNGLITEPVQINYDCDDTDGEHELTIELSGKTFADTKLNDNGEIIEDAVIKCSNFSIDNINADLLMSEQSTYTHDFNGTADKQSVRFYGTLGCNGIVRLSFPTPIYLWLLENM